ncbi:hypothetical protein [Nocardioides xinjiangensis]|uniref:hypothetical protein n=1 Tax=Nocardioides xinjiangensis TaxID=2817376 RepID=UPI001B3165A9|nr:hypothetical protein [Nocardioides sp. SYSU D00514]
MTDLGARFVDSGGEPVELDGQLVHMSYVFGSLPAGVLELRMTAQGSQEQGVGLSADGGWITVNGEKFKEGVLWTATAPDTVEVKTQPQRGSDSLTVRVWNVWKHPKWGSTMAGVANAGLLVELLSADAVKLHASAGPGGPTFDDLVIEASFRPDDG